MKKLIFLAIIILTINIFIIYYFLNIDTINLKCNLKTSEYNVEMKDSITLKFENSKLKYKKEVIWVDYTNNETSNDTFLSYVNKFKENGDNYKKENWKYNVSVNGRKIKITIIGDKKVKEINEDKNDYEYYKNYYENLAYSCN